MTLSIPDVLKWSFTRPDWLLLRLSLFCGAGYLLGGFYFNLTGSKSNFYLLAIVFKVLAVSPLAVLAWRRLSGAECRLLGGALLLSSLGDLFLAIRGGGFFLCGLLSFLAAHLLYIALFIRHRPKPVSAGGWKKPLVAVVLLYAALMAWWLLPVPGGLSLPVTVYLSVLTAMVVAAILTGFESRWIAAGAVLFLISDSLIAVNRFKGLMGAVEAGVLIWATYYNAQSLISLGVMGELLRKSAIEKRAEIEIPELR
jgi:uncharacterized membrane protein YhhN